jgi:hypothetical protein
MTDEYVHGKRWTCEHKLVSDDGFCPDCDSKVSPASGSRVGVVRPSRRGRAGDAFEEWWGHSDNAHAGQLSMNRKQAARNAWTAATSRERERAARVVEPYCVEGPHRLCKDINAPPCPACRHAAAIREGRDG